MNLKSIIQRLRKRNRACSGQMNSNERKLRSLIALFEVYLLMGSSWSNVRSLMLEESPDADPKPNFPQEYLRVYSKGILYLGVEKFLETAVTFCHDVARQGRIPIVSVGCGHGRIEHVISRAYQRRYGSSLDIILVDPDPQYQVHFKYVHDLVEKRPQIVGNCAAFIFWPNPFGQNDGYDIEALRMLLPLGVLTVYEVTGGGGSLEFVKFFRGHDTEELTLSPSELGLYNHMNILHDIGDECDSYGLDQYAIDEVARLKEWKGPLFGTVQYRMAIARRMDFRFVNVCPAINWTCKTQTTAFNELLPFKDLGDLSTVLSRSR